MDPILFFDLKTQAKRLRSGIEKRLLAVLDHGAYINGPEVIELERTLERLTGAPHALAVASGTDSLVIAMMGEDLGPGDAVFIPTFTYNATCNAVLMTGATPIFVDVDPATFNINIEHLAHQVEAVAREGRLKPRMIVPVDLYGLPADYARIAEIAKRHGMTVLADAAQSLGGGQDGKSVGDLCEMTATSFYPSKTLGAYGDAGAMFTRDPERLARWASIRWHGTDDARKESVRVGLNGRLDSMQCAVLLEKLTVFTDEIATRARIAGEYRQKLGNAVTLQRVPEGTRSAWGLFTITVENRDRFQAELAEKKVPTAIYYQKPLHQHRAFAPFAPRAGELKHAESLSGRIVSLPFHPYLSEAQIAHICDAVRKAA